MREPNIFHFISEVIESEKVTMEHIASGNMTANLLPKALTQAKYTRSVKLLGLLKKLCGCLEGSVKAGCSLYNKRPYSKNCWFIIVPVRNLSLRGQFIYLFLRDKILTFEDHAAQGHRFKHIQM